jgi:hypothetical protein
MAHDVFISYASPDRHVANAVCARLEQAAVRCWIAPRDVGAGNYPSALVRAITSSKLLVVVVSQGANGSPNVSREVHHAVKKGKVIVPFRIEDVLPSGDLEYLLDITHWLDAITPPLDRHLQMLVAKIQGLLADPEDASAHTTTGAQSRPRPSAELMPFVLTLPEGYASIGDPVYAAGTFNNWLNAVEGRLNADAQTLARYRLERTAGKGRQPRQVSIGLPPGEYEFKFVTGQFRWLPWIAGSEHDKGQDAVGGPNFRAVVA